MDVYRQHPHPIPVDTYRLRVPRLILVDVYRQRVPRLITCRCLNETVPSSYSGGIPVDVLS